MNRIRVGGRTYSDPDIISLVQATGELIDPRSSVISQARKLTGKLRSFPGVPTDAFERVSILASMLGMRVEAMNVEQRRSESRDAVLITTTDGQRVILYNPSRSRARVAFSIAHEITHTFFPNSVSGARFRTVCREDSKEANELERLCDLGGSEIVLPESDFREAVGRRFSLTEVKRVSEVFGTSFEATAFRMATAHPAIAIAGLVRFRLTKDEQRAEDREKRQGQLFISSGRPPTDRFERKYRRQSLHLSDACGDEHIIRWNKSFDTDSIVYVAGNTEGVHVAEEALPNLDNHVGRLEAVSAPYQRDDAHDEFGDVLFLWSH